MQIGFIGLGKMGSRMAAKLIKEGHELVVWNRTQTAFELLKSELPDSKFDIAVSLKELAEKLRTLR
ncbi:MAG: NAD(P)-binding domain-containing protein, partial [Patescibacteria group bacterium]